jgi:hypothetical protein
MAAGIDGARLMKVARLRNGTALENWKKLLEEANGELEERIKSLFLKKEKEEGPENFLGGSHRQ